jgi:hypothetical protein
MRLRPAASSRPDAVRPPSRFGRQSEPAGDRFVALFPLRRDAGPPAGAERLWALARDRFAGALDAAREELAGVPLAGLILVTDGATMPARTSRRRCSPQARRVPVQRWCRAGAFREDLRSSGGLPGEHAGRRRSPGEVALRVRGGSRAIGRLPRKTMTDGDERTVPVPERGDPRCGSACPASAKGVTG